MNKKSNWEFILYAKSLSKWFTKYFIFQYCIDDQKIIYNSEQYWIVHGGLNQILHNLDILSDVSKKNINISNFEKQQTKNYKRTFGLLEIICRFSIVIESIEETFSNLKIPNDRLNQIDTFNKNYYLFKGDKNALGDLEFIKYIRNVICHSIKSKQHDFLIHNFYAPVVQMYKNSNKFYITLINLESTNKKYESNDKKNSDWGKIDIECDLLEFFESIKIALKIYADELIKYKWFKKYPI